LWSNLAEGLINVSLHHFLWDNNRFWVMLLELRREHKSRENYGAQKSGCKPSSIAIKSVEHVTCHWSTFLAISLVDLLTGDADFGTQVYP
jgi:hypothetical protein